MTSQDQPYNPFRQSGGLQRGPDSGPKGSMTGDHTEELSSRDPRSGSASRLPTDRTFWQTTMDPTGKSRNDISTDGESAADPSDGKIYHSPKSGITRSVASPRRRFPVRRSLRWAGLVLAVLLLLRLAWIIFGPGDTLNQLHIIPGNAALIIRTDEPVRDWQRFSTSEPWATLSRAPSFAEITENTNFLDSVVNNNRTLSKLVGKRDLLISLHRTGVKDWDFLIAADLGKLSRVKLLRSQIDNIIELAGYPATKLPFADTEIIETRLEDGMLYMAFAENQFVASYSRKLIESSLSGRHTPELALESGFIEAEKLVGNKGLCRIYVNYRNLPDFLALYMDERIDLLDQFCNSMDFSGLWFDTGRGHLEMKGYAIPGDEPDAYITALLGSGGHRVRAHEVLPARTAVYANTGFSNPASFLSNLEAAYSATDSAGYAEIVSSRAKLEKYLGISLNEHFISWMSGEFALAQCEPGILASEPETILAIRAKSMRQAKKGMAHIEKRVKNRTPIKVRSVEYKGHDVNYIELKGFFRLFFGSLFDSFEKPYYTYVGDYVVFSNAPGTLLALIEDYTNKNTLSRDAAFKRAHSKMKGNSTFLLYVDTHKLYPHLPTLMTASTWKDLDANKDVLYSFPTWTLQVTGGKQRSVMHFYTTHEPYYEPAVNADIFEDDDPEEMSERELMTELKQFYVEKFEGNILRDFYDDGSLKSESETREGKRHGRYREFYPDGKLKARGKYNAGNKKGVWKYYSEQGRYERKEKFK